MPRIPEKEGEAMSKIRCPVCGHRHYKDILFRNQKYWHKCEICKTMWHEEVKKSDLRRTGTVGIGQKSISENSV